jgi:hypothetical protein
MYLYYTKLDIEECKKRIENEIDNNPFTTGKTRGKVNFSNGTFHLFKTSEHYRNSWSRCFYGKLIEQDQGTILKGCFHLHNFVRLFMVVWLGFFIYAYASETLAYYVQNFSSIPFVSYIARHIPDLPREASLETSFMSLLFIIFGILLMNTGRWFGRKQEEYILYVLKSRLHLKEMDSADFTE